MHCSPVQGNLSDDNGHVVEPAIVWHKDKYDGTTVSPLADWPGNGWRRYSSNFWTLPPWTITLDSCGSNLSHQSRTYSQNHRENIKWIL